MVKVIAIREYRHGGTTYSAGDEADVSEKDARVLTRVKNAPFMLSPNYEVQRPVVEQPQPAVETPSVEMEAKDVVAETDDNPLPRRRYMRRDMVAKKE